jgi:hypothetical protein
MEGMWGIKVGGGRVSAFHDYGKEKRMSEREMAK